MFQFPGFASLTDTISSIQQVSPFGNLRIKLCVPIPAAYRSLSRPSSPLRAQASTVRSYIAYCNFCIFMSYKLFARKLNLNLLFRNFLISCIFFNMSKNIFSKNADCGECGSRTHDLQNANLALQPAELIPHEMSSQIHKTQQLKSSFYLVIKLNVVVSGRLELPTSTLSVQRSNQLSYETPLYMIIINSVENKLYDQIV